MWIIWEREESRMYPGLYVKQLGWWKCYLLSWLIGENCKRGLFARSELGKIHGFENVKFGIPSRESGEVKWDGWI